MTANHTRSQITMFTSRLLESGLAIDTNATIIRDGRIFTSVIWASAPKSPSSFKDFPFATVADYRRIIERKQYSFMLNDGSVIRAHYLYRHGDVAKHHLSYYPCPININEDEIPGQINIEGVFDTLLFESISNWEGLHYSKKNYESETNLRLDHEEKIRLLMKTPIRFDYDPGSHSENHPCSHVHMMVSDCRIPVFGPLSFGHFISFIFRNFYSDYWLEYDFINQISKEHLSRTVTAIEMNDLFFDWRAEIDS